MIDPIVWHWLGHLVLAGVALLGWFGLYKCLLREDEALAVNERARKVARDIWESQPGWRGAAEKILKELSGETVEGRTVEEDEIPW